MLHKCCKKLSKFRPERVSCYNSNLNNDITVSFSICPGSTSTYVKFMVIRHGIFQVVTFTYTKFGFREEWLCKTCSIRQTQFVMILRDIIAWRQLFDVKSTVLPDTYLHKMLISQNIATYIIYRQISNIRRTKSHNLNASRLALQLLLCILFKPGVK